MPAARVNSSAAFAVMTSTREARRLRLNRRRQAHLHHPGRHVLTPVPNPDAQPSAGGTWCPHPRTSLGARSTLKSPPLRASKDDSAPAGLRGHCRANEDGFLGGLLRKIRASRSRCSPVSGGKPSTTFFA